MRHVIYPVIPAIALASGLMGSPVSALEITVDCDKGQSIQKAVDSLPAATKNSYVVSISGICTENVTIRRPMLVIDGNIGDTGPAIEGTIRIFTHDVRVQFLTVTGPGRGIVVSNNGSAELIRVEIFQNEGVGIQILRGGTVALRSSTVAENGSGGAQVTSGVLEVSNSDFISNWDEGIVALHGGDVRLTNGSAIQAHPGNGISLRNGSTVILDGADISGNANGIEARAGDVYLEGSTAIYQNTGNGIDANLHSTVQMENSSIYENGGSGIRLEFDSGLLASEGAALYANGGGDVACADTESSAVFLAAEPAEVYCTDFNQVAPAP